jgi:hypothetical protein
VKFVDATISVDSLKQLALACDSYGLERATLRIRLDDASIELLEKNGERTIASYGCTGAEVVIT